MNCNNIIAGPCAAEYEDQILKTAEGLNNIGVKIFRAGVWKPRTKPGGFEGIGIPAFDWLDEVRKKYGMKIAVEVANAQQAIIALGAGTEIIWIGARTVADPFAVQEIANVLSQFENKDNITVYVKNPVSPDLDLWEGGILRIKAAGIKNVGAIHRGFKVYGQSKYRNEPIWRIPLDLKIKYPDMEIYCDPSHMAGDKQYIKELSDIALNVYNFDGLMVETHFDPSCAWTDKTQQLTPAELESELSEIIDKHYNVDLNANTDLEKYRIEIDYCDAALIHALEDRLKASKKIGEYKKEHNMTRFQADRWSKLLNHIIELGKEHDLDEEYVKSIWNIIHERSIKEQI